MKVTVKVPASTANIGTGVDCLGIALSKYLTVVFEPGEELEVVFRDGFARPIPLEQNLVYEGARRVFSRACQTMPPMRIAMTTEIPGSRGLGSSASAIIAGVYGANAWLGEPLSEATLIDIATEIEGHPDNIVPCAVGGFTIAMAAPSGEVQYHKIVPNRYLRFVTAIPDFELSTKKARSVVPPAFSRGDLVTQLQRACFLVGCLASGDLRCLDVASDDIVFTPARKGLIPGFDEVTGAAMEHGAMCAMISGAGPTIIAFAQGREEEIAAAMQGGFAAVGIASQVEVLCADTKGAIVIAER